MSYALTPAEATAARNEMLENNIAPWVRRAFARYPALQSATMLVAQFWCDEAYDAVHCEMVFSVLPTPDLAAAFSADARETKDTVNRPGALPHNSELYMYYTSIEEERLPWWDENGAAIPAFAAFCKEGCHQEMSLEEAFTPYAIFRRNGEGLAIEVVGPMLRPWLDGVPPEDHSEAG